MLLWPTAMQYFGNCQKVEKSTDKKKLGEDNLAQHKYGDRLEKKTMNSIYSCLIEGHYAFSLSPWMPSWIIS